MSELPSRKAISHERIVDVASRDLRRLGYTGVNVTDVMRSAGFTHGGFYGHFTSRDALLAEAVTKAGAENLKGLRATVAGRSAERTSPFAALMDAYLTMQHVQDIETGCPVSLLASEMFRQVPEVAEPSRQVIANLHALVCEVLPDGAAPDAAWAVTSAMLGAVELARALGDSDAARAALADTRRNLLARYDS